MRSSTTADLKMAIDKIFVTNTTSLSLSDRFTILQSMRPPGPRPAPPRLRRLTDRLGLSPVVQAALALQKNSIKSRIGRVGVGLSRGRIGAGTPRLRGLPGPLLLPFRRPRLSPRQRPRPLPNLNRANSTGNASEVGHNRSFRKSQGTKGRGGIRSQSRGGAGSRGARMASGGQGQRVTRAGRGGHSASSSVSSSRQRRAPATKEELDRQLELYMAGTRSRLDMDLDSYMASAGDLQ